MYNRRAFVVRRQNVADCDARHRIYRLIHHVQWYLSSREIYKAFCLPKRRIFHYTEDCIVKSDPLRLLFGWTLFVVPKLIF